MKPKRLRLRQPEATIETCSPLEILLDPHNPRLTHEEEGKPQPELLRTMLERFKIDELADSIIATGYLPFDPLLGYRERNDVIVLEGNRRIAALKVLLSPELAPAKQQSHWKSLSASLTPAVRKSMEAVQIKVFADRSNPELEAYIGFRHVTGVLQWPALEKASFISHLVDQGWTYKAIAECLGSYPRIVERHYVGYRIAEQARLLELPGADKLANSFGVLMRSLQSPGIVDYLGVSFPGDPRKSTSPIPEGKRGDFALFIEWTFGTGEKERVLPDSRKLTEWGKILSSGDGLAYLKRTAAPSFERAWFRSGGESESLEDSLLRAADALEESVALVPLHKDDTTIKRAVERCVDFVGLILRDFPDLRSNLRGQKNA